jgi:proline racemase
MREKLTDTDRKRLEYVSRHDTAETSESPSSSLAILAARGLVKPGPWRQEKSPTGSKIWTVRYFTITEAGRAAIKESRDD